MRIVSQVRSASLIDFHQQKVEYDKALQKAEMEQQLSAAQAPPNLVLPQTSHHTHTTQPLPFQHALTLCQSHPVTLPPMLLQVHLETSSDSQVQLLTTLL